MGEICDCLSRWRCLQLLYEPFDEDFEGRWIVSKKDEYQGMRAHLFLAIVMVSLDLFRSVGLVGL